MTIKEAEIDRRVTWNDGYKTEHGVITSKNDHYIFVKFDGSPNINGIACLPHHLKYEVKDEQESFDNYEEANTTDLEEELNNLLNTK